MNSAEHSGPMDRGRRAVGTLVAVTSTVVWTHVVAALIGAPAASAVMLTVVALVAALAGCLPRRATHAAIGAAVGGTLAVIVASLIGTSSPAAIVVAVPVAATVAALRPWLERQLPAWLPRRPARRALLMAVWTLLALVAVLQVGRLATYMTNGDSDWFLSTRHPLYAKHECFNAYIYGAELDRRGEHNVYDSSHYPGLNPKATPHTELAGMTPEDPFQYPPPFLLLPRLALELTDDYQAMRMVWFGLNFTLCIAAFLTLAVWVGGRAGAWATLGLPFAMASFPVLHNFQYGQFHFAAVALAVLGLLAFASRRTALGGALLAVAILSKLFPAIILVPLAAQRRWRELGFTALAGAAIVALTLACFGAQPFIAFVDYQLPRLSNGQAFAFGEAWPEIEMLITASNQGVQGIVQKLATLGVPWADPGLAKAASRLYLLALLFISFGVGLSTAAAPRAGRAAAWLGLLGLASLGSAGAWADYVPLTAIWALTLIAPIVATRPRPLLLVPALAIGAALQFTLLGTMPVGGYAAGSWMYPLSLLSALTLFGLCAAAIALGARTSAAPVASIAAVGHPVSREDQRSLVLRG